MPAGRSRHAGISLAKQAHGHNPGRHGAPRGPRFLVSFLQSLCRARGIMFLYGEFDLEDGSVSRKWRMSNPLTGGLLNRRNFVTGLSSVCSLVLLTGGLASSEHKSALEQRIRSQM